MEETNTKKQTILVVDDSEMNRSILADMLGDEYNILEAEDGLEAVSVMQKKSDEIDLMLLDIVMPRMNGFDVLGVMNQNGWIEATPVIMVSAESGSPQVERAYDMGVTDFIMRPFDALIVRRRVVNTLLLYAKQRRLVSMVEEQIYEKERRSGMMIDILSHIVEFRNGESGLHILHVRTLTDFFLRLLMQKTDQYHMTAADISRISTGSALHDIGKIAIDEHILTKPGRLTAEEFEIMKTHAMVGARMLEDLPVHQDDPLVQTAYEICRWHHERYDGRGYPDGLAGDDIPISAQVVALADVYDALTSPRVYKAPIPHETAVQMILDGKCGAFNPLLLECLSENAGEIRGQLAAGSVSKGTRREIQAIADESLHSGASKRTLRLLDYERDKYSFFAALTEDIQFEYTVSPPMITLSPWGAKKLGVDEIVMDPVNNPRLQQVLGPGVWDRLSALLHATTPKEPDAHMECLLHYGGEARWHRVISRAVWSSDTPPRFEGALGKAIDVHEARVRLQEMEQKASTDAMTGLLNRASARERIEERIAERPDSNYALAIFDVDRFKSANDTRGHQFGDQVLIQVAQRLRRSIRGTDISCRAGGDEFMLFLEYKTEIEKTIDRIFHSLCGPFEGFNVSVSMGVALGETVGLDYENLFHAADLALYSVKQAGKGLYRFYDRSMKGTLSAITAIDTEARQGGDAS